MGAALSGTMRTVINKATEFATQRHQFGARNGLDSFTKYAIRFIQSTKGIRP